MRQLKQEESDEFLKLHRQLMFFTNKRHGIYKPFKTVSDFADLSDKDKTEGIKPIREKMYHEDNISAFCQENPFELTEDELIQVSIWKGRLNIRGYILRHLAEYTVFYSEEFDQLYGIKSITTDLSDLLPKQVLPYLVEAILLPFKENIVYDGFLDGYALTFGGNITSDLKKEYDYLKAIKGIYSCYQANDHLANPPETSTIKDKVSYSMKCSIKRGEFPTRALEFAESSNERDVFEKLYSKHFVSKMKKIKSYNDELPKMHYAIYRDCVIAVMPSKKEAKDFCLTNYPDISPYITYAKF